MSGGLDCCVYKRLLPDELPSGTVLAGYRIDAPLGRGGMGCVYRATQLKLNRAVALKVIAATFASDADFRERFRREALAAASVEHPHVLPVFEADESGGTLFLSMRLVEGRSLAEWIAADGPLAPREAVPLICQVAAALDAAHARGIVHRDVKPANVLLAESGDCPHAYLTDFGIARRSTDEPLTATGKVVGTLEYVAPEVLRGETPGAAADVYALGCTLFEALAGRRAFPGGTPEAVIYEHLFEPVPSVRDRGVPVDAALDEIVSASLAKRPEDRPRTAGELGSLLLSAQDGAGDATRVRRVAPPRRAAPGPEPGARTDAVRSARDGLGNLPIARDTLVGRERELGELVGALEDAPLITLTGPGGAGKTRLAIAVASAARERFFEGVWVVELAALDAGELVAMEVAGAFGLRDAGEKDWTDRLAEHLQDRELLLVVDNCEHLLDAASHVADRLLRACPRVVILCTSREPLGVAGERVYRVGTLAVPPPAAAFAEIRAADAVRLFCQRASEQQPGFALTEHNSPAVAAICRSIDGMPLAIELAAARTRSLAVTDIAERLDRRFQLLTAGSRTALPHHQTLRAAIDWSFELLDDAERRLLCELSVFAGDFDPKAVEAVCSPPGEAGPDVLTLTGALVDKSLVNADVTHPAGTRYSLLETIRQYAAEQLTARGAHREHSVRMAHLQHYVAHARSVAPKLIGPEQAGWLDRLDADFENLRAALEFAAGHADPGPGLQLVAALAAYWERRGRSSEGADLIARALVHPRVAEAPVRDQAAACLAGAYVAAMLGAYGEQLRYASRVLELLEPLDDALAERSVALTHRVIGSLLGGADVAPAARDAAAALELARQSGDPWVLARAEQALVQVEYDAGRLDACVQWQRRALDRFRETGDAWRVALLLSNGADIKLAIDDAAGARQDLEAALLIAEQLQAGALRSQTLHNLAMVELIAGENASAEAHARDAFVIADEVGDREGRACAILDLAIVAGRAGDDRRAALLHAASDAASSEPFQRHEQRLRDEAVKRLQGILDPVTFESQRREGAMLSDRDVRALIASGMSAG